MASKKSTFPEATMAAMLFAAAMPKVAAKYPPLGAEVTAFLDVFGAHWQQGISLQVVQAMQLCPNSSTTTAHRFLKALRKGGWVELRTSEEDQRIKFIEPTSQTVQYFAAMGAAMEKAVKASKP